jgi:hypothetical protein
MKATERRQKNVRKIALCLEIEDAIMERSNMKTHKTRILSSINGDEVLDGPIVLSHCGFSSFDVLLEIEI